MNVLRDITVLKVQDILYNVHLVILLTLQDKLSVRYVLKDGELSSSHDIFAGLRFSFVC